MRLCRAGDVALGLREQIRKMRVHLPHLLVCWTGLPHPIAAPGLCRPGARGTERKASRGRVSGSAAPPGIRPQRNGGVS